MKNKFFLLSEDNGYLREQFEIEGLVGYFLERSTLPSGLDRYPLVVSNKTAISAGEIIDLRDYVRRGGFLLAVKPSRALELAFQVTRGGNLLSGYLHDEENKESYQIFEAVCYKAGRSLYHCSEQKEGNRHPVIFRKSFGKGEICIVGFDFALTLFLLLQGRDILPSDRDNNGIPRADCGRIVEEDIRFVPQADRLRGILVRLVEDGLSFPIPRLWYFPNRKRGGVAFTHDSDSSRTREIDAVNRMDVKAGLRATTFMRIVDGSPFCWRKMTSNRSDLQLHPVFYFRLPKTNKNTKSQSGFDPPPSIKKMAFFLQNSILQVVARRRTSGIRNHGLVWPKMEPNLRWLSRLKVQYDSTLGSNYYCGYMYGTGLPYSLRLQGSYEDVDILEFPLHIMDSVFIKGFGEEWRNEDPFLIIKYILDSAFEKNHSLITLNFHHFFLMNKRLELNNMELYKKVTQYVKQRGFQVVNLTHFNKFWRTRKKVKFSRILWERLGGELNFSIESEEPLPGLCYILPKTFRGSQLLESSEKDGETIVLNGRQYNLYQNDIKGKFPVRKRVRYANS